MINVPSSPKYVITKIIYLRVTLALSTISGLVSRITIYAAIPFFAQPCRATIQTWVLYSIPKSIRIMLSQEHPNSESTENASGHQNIWLTRNTDSSHFRSICGSSAGLISLDRLMYAHLLIGAIWARHYFNRIWRDLKEKEASICTKNQGTEIRSRVIYMIEPWTIQFRQSQYISFLQRRESNKTIKGASCFILTLNSRNGTVLTLRSERRFLGNLNNVIERRSSYLGQDMLWELNETEEFVNDVLRDCGDENVRGQD